MKGNWRALVLCLLALWAGARTGRADDLEYAPAPVANPLKGFMGGDGPQSIFPHSMDFKYVPLAEVLKGPDTYDWKSLDDFLEKTAAQGNQAVFRVYLSWPGRKALPAFLQNTASQTKTGTSPANNFVPNYDDPVLSEALTNFVAAMGVKYDGDSRIGFIEAGLLGTWGEWLAPGKMTEYVSESAQTQLTAAYASAFHLTKVLMRWPSKFNVGGPFGYDDEWFAHPTGGLTRLLTPLSAKVAKEKWKDWPFGGRLHPEYKTSIWQKTDYQPTDEAFQKSAKADHVSWLLLPGNFTDINAAAKERALQWARMLGYELYCKHAEITGGTTDDPSLHISVTLTNTGMAPFYYKWPVELAVVADKEVKATWVTEWDITSVVPGDGTFKFKYTAENPALPTGTYRVLLRVVNPLPNGHPLQFANKAQDADKPGWLTLGDVEIKP